MTIIVTITRNRAIGQGGDMIYHISADLKRFKSITMGHPLVMGRKTFESFPNGPLPGRRNLVITSNPDYQHPGIETFPSLQAALEACGEADPMIIGGVQIYAQAMSMASRMLITEIDAEAPEADTFFPEIDKDMWEKTEIGPWISDEKNGVNFRFVEWRRKN